LAIDANPQAVAFAAHAFAGPRLEFRRALVDELDSAPGSFDRIALLEVIEHLGRSQGAALLARFHTLLAPGGRLVVSTPNRHSVWPLVEWLLDRSGLAPQLAGDQHEVIYTLAELRALGERAGLRLVEHRMINSIAPWAAWLSTRLARALHRCERRHVRRHGAIMVLAFDKLASGDDDVKSARNGVRGPAPASRRRGRSDILRNE
jgi:cyclopropane fatty-acyl-phospholipid synthase-like methyltransferase